MGRCEGLELRVQVRGFRGAGVGLKAQSEGVALPFKLVVAEYEVELQENGPG